MQPLTQNTITRLQTQIQPQDIIFIQENRRNLAALFRDNQATLIDASLPSFAEIEQALDRYLGALNAYCAEPIENLSLERQKTLRAEIYTADVQLEEILEKLKPEVQYKNMLDRRRALNICAYMLGIPLATMYVISLGPILTETPCSEPCPPDPDDDTTRFINEDAYTKWIDILTVTPIIVGVLCFTYILTDLYLRRHRDALKYGSYAVDEMHGSIITLRQMTEAIVPRTYAHTKRAYPTHVIENNDNTPDAANVGNTNHHHPHIINERTPLLSQHPATFYTTINMEQAAANNNS